MPCCQCSCPCSWSQLVPDSTSSGMRWRSSADKVDKAATERSVGGGGGKSCVLGSGENLCKGNYRRFGALGVESVKKMDFGVHGLGIVGHNGRYQSTECPRHRQFQPLVLQSVQHMLSS